MSIGPIESPGRRRGVTLLELLVTLVVSSVVVVGLGSLFVGAATDYERAARNREERYSRQLLEAELIWRTKVVPPEFLPTGGVGGQIPPIGQPPNGGFGLQYADDSGSIKLRKILVFDYPHDDERTRVIQNDPPFSVPPVSLQLNISGAACQAYIPQTAVPDAAGNLQNVQLRTAAIFQYFSVVYVVERDITTPNNSFRTMAQAGTLAAFLYPMFNSPPANLGAVPGASAIIGPTPLAIGVDNLDFQVNEPAALPACTAPTFRDAVRQRRVTWQYSQYL